MQPFILLASFISLSLTHFSHFVSFITFVQKNYMFKPPCLICDEYLFNDNHSFQYQSFSENPFHSNAVILDLTDGNKSKWFFSQMRNIIIIIISDERPNQEEAKFQILSFCLQLGPYYRPD